MSAPTIDPHQHTVPIIAPPNGYRSGQPVWIHQPGGWRPGVVLHGSAKAVTVRYRPTDGRGTGVDTVTADSLTTRDEEDPFLDLAATAC